MPGFVDGKWVLGNEPGQRDLLLSEDCLSIVAAACGYSVK